MESFPHVRLFGGPALVARDGERPLTPGQRAFLALPYVEAPGTLTRERITWLLWEDGESRRTRHRIRQLIYSINALASAPVLERSGESVLPRLPSDTDGISARDGDPLALVTPPTTAYEQWLDGSKEHLRRLRRRVLAAELDRATLNRDLNAVRRVAEQVKALGIGDTGAVLDHAWSLQRLGCSREAEWVVQEAMSSVDSRGRDQLLSALDALRAAQPLHAPGGHGISETTPLGRDDLIAATMRHLRDPSRRGVALFGPTAVGKTILLREVVSEVSIRFPQHPVLAICRNSHSRTAPFRLCQDLLLQPWAFSHILDRPQLLTPVLRQAFPSLAKRIGVEPPRDALDPAPEAVSRHFSNLFRTMLGGRTGLLAIDDLELSDAGSLRLIQNMLSEGGVDLRVACTLTAETRGQAATFLTSRLPKIRSLELQEVPELNREDSVSLVLSASGRSLSTHDARNIYRLLGGLPGYLIEAASMPRAPGEGGAPHLPRNAQELVESRLARVSSPERLLCSVLAISGSATSVGVLAEVLDQPIHRISLLVERLVESSLLIRQDEGVWFRQRFVASGAYSRISQEERQAFHRRFLSVAQREVVSSHSLQRHTTVAGDPADLLHSVLLREAVEAEHRGALEEAADLWESAAVAARTDTQNHEATIREVDARIRLRQFDKALDSLRAAERLSGLQACHGRHEGEIRLRAFLIQSLTDPGSVDKTTARELIGFLGRSGGDVAYAKAVDTALSVADFLEDVDWTRELLHEADRIKPSSPEASIWVHLARTRHLYLGDPSRGLSSAREAVVQAGLANVPGALGRALNRLIVAMVFQGRLGTPEGTTAIMQARETARRLGDQRLLYDTYVNEGSWFMDIGELEAATRSFDQAREILGSDSSQLESLTTKVNRGELLIHLGRGAEATEEFESALSLAGERGAGRHLCVAGLALSALELGRLRKAREWIGEIEGIRQSQRFRGNLSLVCIARARVAQAGGRTAEALETLLGFAREMLPWMVPASLKLYLEAFRLSLRSGVRLRQEQFAPAMRVAQELSIPGNGVRILQLRDRLQAGAQAP